MASVDESRKAIPQPAMITGTIQINFGDAAQRIVRFGVPPKNDETLRLTESLWIPVDKD